MRRIFLSIRSLCLFTHHPMAVVTKISFYNFLFAYFSSEYQQNSKMLRVIVSKSISGVRCRSISFAAKNFDKVTESTTAVQGKLKSSISSFDQKVLVWTKKYKSIEDIPERVA